MALAPKASSNWCPIIEQHCVKRVATLVSLVINSITTTAIVRIAMEDELDTLLSQFSERELTALLFEGTSCDCLRPFEPVHGTGDDSSLPLYSNEPGPSACSAPVATGSTSASSSRFSLTDDSQLTAAKASALSKNTAKNTAWSVNIWKEWSRHRQQSHPGNYSEWPIHLYLSNDQQLDHWLSKFVLEARKKNGEQYPPNSIYAICCGLQRYVQDYRPEVNFFTSTSFAGFRKVLDGVMKQLRSSGLGVHKKQAEPITPEEENLLWEKGMLGDHTPQVLVDTMLFLCGLNFALRSGNEHRSLQTTQFKISSSLDGSSQLEYTENFSKNNSGGLAHRKVKPKQVVHHSNASNPSRCLVRLFQTYLSHHPPECKTTAFYLTPLKKPKGNVWYTNTPIGHNTLDSTISRMCKAAGISGYKTNHSLRVTTATRLFQSGVDEQLIMARTGHRSIEGIRTYKRVGEEQKQALSDILNAATNGEQPCSKKQHLEEDTDTSLHASHSSITSAKSISVNTAHPISSHAPTIHFTGCSSITVNFNQYTQ